MIPALVNETSYQVGEESDPERRREPPGGVEQQRANEERAAEQDDEGGRRVQDAPVDDRKPENGTEIEVDVRGQSSKYAGTGGRAAIRLTTAWPTMAWVANARGR